MLKRTLVSVALLVIGLPVIFYGGIVFGVVFAVVLGLAAYEFARLFQAGGYQPSLVLTVVGVLALALARALGGFAGSDWLISLLVLAAMTYHLWAYERGGDQAATDFAITLAGVLYVGWLGAYMISLRLMPDGIWWFLIVLPAVWLADSGAYLVGSRIGRHKMVPRLSPKKSWEGYIGGIVFAVVGAALLALLFQFVGGPLSSVIPWIAAPTAAVTPGAAAVLGLILGVLTLLGDLGESMIKRQVGQKDSGNLLPGHGGVFDRIDSWLWAGVIGYYLILWWFI